MEKGAALARTPFVYQEPTRRVIVYIDIDGAGDKATRKPTGGAQAMHGVHFVYIAS